MVEDLGVRGEEVRDMEGFEKVGVNDELMGRIEGRDLIVEWVEVDRGFGR